MLIQTKRMILAFLLASNLILLIVYHQLNSILKISLKNPSENDNTPHSSVKGLVPRPTFDPSEKYLAYLPHSGFHNQRITLENALLLAKYLNRTLLVPPVFLGPATEWRLFDILHRRVMLQTKRGLDHCGRVPKGESLPAECLNYYSWTTVRWDFFYDMERIGKEQPWKYRSDHSFAWMETHLGIDRRKDIHIIEDTSHYDYQIFDDPNSITPLNTLRYRRKLTVKELADRPERVLHMGSLFATGRVLAELPENKDYQQFLKRTMILSTPILVKTSDAIVERLGGLGSFVGLHLRVGDGMFVVPAPENIENMFKNLVNITGITPIPNYPILPTNAPAGREVAGDKKAGILPRQDKDDEGVAGLKADAKPAPVPMPLNAKIRATRMDVAECRARQKEGGKYQMIYIATDGVYPRRNILFRKLFDHFPCIFTLDDFSEFLGGLKEMKNDDGVGLSKDLVPMVDAVVSAKGRYFMGTPKSTFSTYVSKQLHPAFVEKLFDQDGNPV
ncbi:hypothetical protein BG011_007505 [Mortierella polycephala]|uniref:CigA protein n=1 Tax=Mortierella polycephala TaxID=41804 RepID=A0A9P6PT93_9FUNG|nr:hypothetical protein BG011_007505 [Mortierella polycephala]